MIATALLCTAMGIFIESRGEVYKGQVAVASVILKRVDKQKSDPCTEINRQGQFPWAKDKFKKVKGQYHLIAKSIPPDDSWFRSLALASDILDGTVERLPNIISFDSKPHPEWNMHLAYKIGNHYFYEEKSVN